MMTRTDYEALLRKAEEKRTRGHEQIDADHAERVRALTLVWAMVEDEPDGQRPINGEPTSESVPMVIRPITGKPAAATESLVGPTAFVRKAIEQVPPFFKMPDLAEWLAKHYPECGVTKPQISSALNKLALLKKVRKEEEGTGKNNPSLWRNLEKQPDSLPAGIKMEG